MKAVPAILLLGVVAVTRAQDIEPAVNTSKLTPTPTDSVAPAAPTPTPAAAPAAARASPATKNAAPGKQPAGQNSKSPDQITLDTTQITGNKELPKVMYIVPWKRGDIGDQGGGPGKSLMDEVLAPVDRDVFRRQNRYFANLQTASGAAAGKPTVTPGAGATATLPTLSLIHI